MSKTAPRQSGTASQAAASDHSDHEAEQERTNEAMPKQRDPDLKRQLRLACKVLIEQADTLRALVKH